MVYQAIGKPVPRAEGPDKVTGRTTYAADVTLPGVLWAKVLRSPVPHAKVLRVDVSAARAAPGVHAVLTEADLPPLLLGWRMRDMPLLATDRVRYVGDPVALVAAETPEAAEEAAALIQVEYEELPGAFDPVEAMKPTAPLIHEAPAAYQGAPPRSLDLPNLQSFTVWERGDLAAGFQKAHRVFEHTFRTQLTHHGYLEPHACTVWTDPEGVVRVWASSKNPFSLRDTLANVLGIPQERVAVQVMSVGGDFGGKSALREAFLCYFLAQRTGRPVKLVLTYEEELLAASRRHPAVITLRTGVQGDGALCAMEVRAVFSGGAYAAYKPNPQVTVLGARQAGSCYRIPAIRVEDYCVYTNHPPGTQHRSPGAPQIVFAVESQMDIIARELGLDPVEFRLRNVITEGEMGPLGQKWQNIRAKETLLAAAQASNWGQPKPSTHYGRGIALYERAAGAGKSGAAVTVDREGRVTATLGVPDCGQGVYTMAQQIAAEVLGVAPALVQVRVADTATVPYDSGVGGSKSTNSAGHAVSAAATEVRGKLLACAARYLRCSPEDVRLEEGRVVGLQAQAIAFADLARLAAEEGGEAVSHTVLLDPPAQPPVTSFCAQVAEVEVDPQTGQVRLHRLVTAHDVGTILNPVTHQGQIAGGVVQAMGLALIEETPLVDGRVAAAHLGEFKLPTMKEIPELRTVLVQGKTGPAPYQGKAIGEVPNVPTPAAIANAIADAVGVHVLDLPVTAEKVHRGMRKGPGPPRAHPITLSLLGTPFS